MSLPSSLPVDQQLLHVVQSSQSERDSQVLTTIALEERQLIWDKLRSIVAGAPGHLPREEELYLEQQISDMVGFEVAAELEGHRLTHSIGTLVARPHLKRYTGDSLSEHDAYLEAGLAETRGAFGWFTDKGRTTLETQVREKYYVAAPLTYLPEWHVQGPLIKEWYAFRKMLVINPAEERVVVAVMGDIGPTVTAKHQFGGSPEVVRTGRIWSRPSRGRVLVFHVNDPEDRVPLGPIDLKL